MSHSSPLDPSPDSVPPRAGAGAAPIIGERVHNYEIVSKIGEGGMGAVYLASHQFFERKAALKVLHARLSGDENSVRRFMNEARAANAIRHPNIIEVVDTGFLPRSGAPYLLTEYLEGESLGARLRRLGRLPFDTALQIAGQTASALAAAHDQGIVHRDLKPENLFLLPRPGNPDLVKVLDFGIAKLRLQLAGAAIQTAPGTVVGTPRYMSPEQCRGDHWPVDHRTDIYSLGLILYEMLAGLPAFDSPDIAELMTEHLSAQPERLRAHVPDVPVYVEAAVMCCLNKNPSDRFPSMRELRQALGSAAVPRVPASPGHTEPPAIQTLGAPPGREPRRTGWIGLAAAIVVAIAGLALWRGRPATPVIEAPPSARAATEPPAPAAEPPAAEPPPAPAPAIEANGAAPPAATRLQPGLARGPAQRKALAPGKLPRSAKIVRPADPPAKLPPAPARKKFNPPLW